MERVVGFEKETVQICFIPQTQGPIFYTKVGAFWFIFLWDRWREGQQAYFYWPLFLSLPPPRDFLFLRFARLSSVHG